MRWLVRLFRDQGGQDIIEYALLAFFISIAAIIVIKLIGPILIQIYTAIKEALT